MPASANTLDDYLSPRLRIVSVGLNPSWPSVRDGYYFSGKRNRFWPALNRSKLLQQPVTPSVQAMHYLLEVEKIGFTDTVKRPTANGSALRAADYKMWVPVLQDKLLALTPETIWFHGKVAYHNYLRYSAASKPKVGIEWGLQPDPIGSAKVIVTPNPSPANAIFPLQELVDWFDAVALLSRG